MGNQIGGEKEKVGYIFVFELWMHTHISKFSPIPPQSPTKDCKIEALIVGYPYLHMWERKLRISLVLTHGIDGFHIIIVVGDKPGYARIVIDKKKTYKNIGTIVNQIEWENAL